MKKIVVVVVLFCIFVLFLLKNNSNKRYKVVTNSLNFEVYDSFTYNKKNEADNHYYEIKFGDIIYNFYVFNSNKKMVIDNIYYGKYADFSCILPSFKGEFLTDILCNRDGIIYNFSDLNFDLPDVFKNYYVQKGKNYFRDYDGIQYNSNAKIFSDYFVSIAGYKYLYLLNKENKFKIFENDTYKRNISMFIDNYYFSADYSQNNYFNKFYLFNVNDGSRTEIGSNFKISFDSYIQGYYDNCIYIFDRNDRKQYKIDVKHKEISIVGDSRKGITVFNGDSFYNVNAGNAYNNEILFFSNNISSDNIYKKIEKVGTNLSGYYYFYLYHDGVYSVYRACIRNKNIKTYLFDVDSIKRIKYQNDFVFYVDDNKLNYYSLKYGIDTIIVYDEFSFNDNLLYGVFEK